MVSQFPYVIYFRDLPQRIQVLAVLHTSRDPDVWRSRISGFGFLRRAGYADRDVSVFFGDDCLMSPTRQNRLDRNCRSVTLEKAESTRRSETMDIAATLAEIQTLPVEDRLRIVDAIWDGIEDEGKSVVLTPALKQELDRRIAGYEANPDDVLSWEEVRASLQAEL